MQSSNRGVRLSVAAGLVLAACLAGCGDSDKGDDQESGPAPAETNGIAEMKPPQALRAAIKAHRKVDDVVYKGRVLEGFGIVLRAADATLSATARACEFKLSSGHLGAVTMRFVNGIRYTRGSEKAMAEVFELAASDFDIIGNRWLSEPLTDDDFQCSPVAHVTDDIDIAACLPGPEGEVDGAPTVAVRCRRNAGEYRLHIATTGKPLVLWLEQVSTSGDDLTLVAADSGIRITAPPKRDVIDMTAFE